MLRSLFYFALRGVAPLLLGLGCNLTGIGATDEQAYSACEAFINSYNDEDGAACAEELDCEARESAQACADAPSVSGDQGLRVACHWGRRFIGRYEGEMCSGKVDEVCIAAVLIGEGGPPCAGYFEEQGEDVAVLNLSCAEPIRPGYSACFDTPHEEGICTCVDA